MKSIDPAGSSSIDYNNIPFPIVVYHRNDGKLIHINRAARKLFGFSSVESKTHKISDIRPIKLKKTNLVYNGCEDFGIAVHTNKKGKQISLRVLRKSITLESRSCYVEFLENVTVYTDELAGSLIDTSLDAVISVDKNGHVIEWNRAAEQIFGWKKSEAIRKNLTQLIIPERFQQQHRRGMKKYLQTGEGKMLNRLIEMTALHKQGHEFPVELNIAPIKRGDTEVIYSFIRDISERKKKNNELEQSELYLKRAQSIASIGSWEMSGKFQETYWSDEFYSIHGLEPQSVKPSTRLRLSMVHPNDRAKLQTAIDGAIRMGQPFAIEKRLILPSKEIRWVLSKGETTTDSKTGKRKVFGTIRDITQSKLQNERIEQLNHSLADFQSAITASSIVSRADKNGIITYVNENFIQISGYTADELIGKNHRIINSAFHPKRFWVDMWKTIAAGKNWRAEVKNKAKDGSFYWVDTFVMPFVDEQGKVREFLSIRNDITIRKQAEEALENANARFSDTILFGKMGSIELNMDSFDLLVSKELYHLLDIEVHEAQTCKVEEFVKKFIHPAHFDHVQHVIAEGVRNQSDTRKVLDLEFEMVTASGRVIWIEAKGIFKGNTALGILHDVTEKKEAEQKIIREKELSESIINGLPGTFFLFDEDQRFLKWNKNFEVVTGYTAEEINNLSLLDFFDDLNLVQERLKAVYTHGTAEADIHLITKSKKKIPYYFNGWLKEYEGKMCVVAIGMDLTLRKNAEAEATSKAHIIENMISGITDGFFATDRDLNFTMISPVFAQLAQMKEESMLGKNMLYLFPFMEGKALLQNYRQAIETGQSLSMESESTTEVSKTYHINVYPNPNGLFVFYRDISEARIMQQALATSEQRLKRILNGLPVAVYLTDSEGYITEHNEAATHLWGRKANLLQDQWIASHQLFTAQGESLAPSDSPMAMAIKNKVEIVGEELILEKPDGTRFRFMAYSIPITDAGGNLQGAMNVMVDITQRLKNEADLRLARFVIDHSSESLFRIREDGSLLEVNEAACRLLGYSAEELLSIRIPDIDPHYNSTAWPAHWQELREKGSINLITQQRKKDGTLIDVEVSANHIFFEGHEFNCAFIRNITERKKTEAEIKTLAMIASRTSNAVLLTDADGKITWANNGFERISEYALHEVMGRKPGDFLQGTDTRSETVAYMHAALAKAEGFRVELLNYTKSGRAYWLDLEVMPLKDDTGKLTGYMAIESDITVLKNAMEEMGQANERFSLVTKATNDVIWDRNLLNDSVWWNYNYYTSFGYTSEMMQPSISAWSKAIHPDDSARVLEGVERVIRNGETFWSDEYRYLKKDGSEVFIQDQGFIMFDENGKPMRMIGSMKDVTEIKKSQRELQKVYDELNAILNASGEATFFLDPSYAIIVFNKAGEEYIRKIHNKQVQRGDSILDYSAKTTIDGFKQNFGRALQGEAVTIEREINHSEKITYWWEVRYLPVKNDQGIIIGVSFTSVDITSRKAAERELKEAEAIMNESRERLLVITNNLPNVAIYQYEVPQGEFEGRYKYFSDGLEKITGLSVEALMKDPYLFEKQIFAADIEEKHKKIQEANANLSVFNHSYRFQHVNGEWRWLRTHSQPTSTKDGNIVWNGLIIDITNQTETEIKLNESEQRFDDFMRHTPVGNWITDKDGTLLYMNESYTSIFDFPHNEQAIGKSIFTLYPQPIAQQFLDNIQAVVREGKPIRAIELAPRPDKTMGEFLVYKFPLAHGLVGGTAIDISDQKEAERKLIESEDRLRSIIQNEPNCVKVLNQKGEVLEMNNSGLRMIEADSLDSLRGYRALEIVDEPFRQSFNELLAAVIAGETGTLKFTITGLKGTKRWLEMNAVPLKDRDNNHNLLLGITRDITEQQKRAQLLEAIHDLQATFITQSEPKFFFEFALRYILQLTESEYGFIGEVLYENDLPYLKTTAITNIAWDDDTRAFYKKHSAEGLIFKNLQTLFGAVMTTGKLVLSNNPDEDERRGGLPKGHPALNSFAGIPLHKGTEMIGMLGIANHPGGYQAEVIQQLNPLLETLTNIVEAYRNEKERKYMEGELMRTTKRLELATEAAELGIWDADFKSDRITWDRYMKEIYGFDPGPEGITKAEWASLIHPDDFARAEAEDNQLINSGSRIYKNEYRIVRKDNRQVRHIKTLGVIERNPDGQVTRMTGVNMDKTIDIIYENQLIESLQEKELLIKEIHHRVKNNLQLISSVMFIRMNKMKDDEAREFLEETRQKVHAIALIHETLLQKTEAVNQIDVADFLRKIIVDLQLAYSSAELLIEVEESLEQIQLKLDAAINCSLVLNELYTNAVKHAFAGRNKGRIKIQLLLIDELVHFIFSDDGVGLPLTMHPGQTGSFGMQMLDVFFKQLKATIKIERSAGTSYHIIFSAEGIT